MEYTLHYRSPLGPMLIASSRAYITGIWFEGQEHFAETLDPRHKEDPGRPILKDAKRWLDLYFARKHPLGFPPYKIAWRNDATGQIHDKICFVSYGGARSYQWVADVVNTTQSKVRVTADQVKEVCDRNPLSLIIPDHRLVESDGSLYHYQAGLMRKMALLQLEGGWEEHFYLPPLEEKA